MGGIQTGTLVIGKAGQLATALKEALIKDEATKDKIAKDKTAPARQNAPNHSMAKADEAADFIFRGRLDHDFFDQTATQRLIERHNIGTLINTAAYTGVDQAEAEPEAADRLNRDLPKTLATVCRQMGCRLIHISTDYVFDGQQAKGQAYAPHDTPNPINVYGKSKLAGEDAICGIDQVQAKIIRTSWLHSAFGKNFQTTMQRLMRERAELRVVNDQWGTPTHANDLARHLIHLSQSPTWTPKHIHHFRSQPTMTWYDLACQIKQNMTKNDHPLAKIIPIPTTEYPTPAKRGKNTSLSPWQN